MIRVKGMLLVLEAVFAGVLVGVLNRIVAHIQTHGLRCDGPGEPDETDSCSSQSSAVVEATAHIDPGAHFFAT